MLLLKQAGVELFSNISGLVYKEFPGEQIEAVFEDIRSALESGSAQKGGRSVPKDTSEVLAKTVKKSLDVIAHEWPRMERDSIKKGLGDVVKGLPESMHPRRIKAFLTDQRKLYEAQLARAEGEAESAKTAFGADPEHGGKMAAMTLALFTCIAPRSAIDLIDRLLSEVSFLESEGSSPTVIVERVTHLCDTHLQ